MKNKISYSSLMMAFFFVAFANHHPKAKTPLASYIKDQKYEAFTIPRTDWGVGTVIKIKKGKEEIIALNGDCLKLSEVSAEAFLPNSSYSVDNSDDLELNIAKGLLQNADLKGAFKDHRVKKIVINIKNAKETIIPTIQIKEKIRDLGTNKMQDCIDAIVSSKNMVITRVLSVDSLSYSFLDSSSHSIPIDANLLQKININVNLQKKYEGKTDLVIDKKTYIGYRVSTFNAKGGFTVSDIKDTEVAPFEIEKLKKAK